MRLSETIGFFMILLAAGPLVRPAPAVAHCDAVDGPVVATARAALESGDVTPVLKWVAPADENSVVAAFRKTMKVRTLSPAASELADSYFFETVVRIHRASENAPYTGLRPAGRIPPIIAMADRAAEAGGAAELTETISDHVRSGIEKRLQRLLATRDKAGDSVEAGREYIAAYVDYVHYVEGLHEAAVGHGDH